MDMNALFQIVKSRESYSALVNSIVMALGKTATSHPVVKANLIVPSVTASENNKRLDWCLRYALESMSDKGWAIDRVCDTMQSALVAHIEGKPEAPEGRTFWSGD